MPNFYWRGVDVLGCMYKGVISARSYDELSSFLLSKSIAITSYRVNIPFSLFFIRQSLITNILSQVETLLRSGILLPKVLEIICKQIRQKSLKKIFLDILEDVNTGTPLYSAVSMYPFLFDSFSIQIIKSGEESGTLCNALEKLVSYRQMIEKWKQNIKSAAFLPSIALFIFFIVAIVICTVVTPMFESLFASIGKQLPLITRYILRLNNYFSVKNISIFLGFLIFSLFLFKYNLKKKRVALFCDKLILLIPFVRNLLKDFSGIIFLHSYSILLSSGIPNVKALKITSDGIKNLYLKQKMLQIIDSVAAGSSFAQELSNIKYKFFDDDIIALIFVGQECGMLSKLVYHAAESLQDKVRRKLYFFVSIFQPILICILGVLIMLLICSVYIPIFNISSSIGV